MPHSNLTAVTAPPSGRWRPRPTLPRPGRTLRELVALRGIVRTINGSVPDRDPRSGQGAPVLLIPGFLAGDRSLEPLAAHLADAGYDPYPAQIARNVDCSEVTTAHLAQRLERVSAACGRPVALIGHSRGGMFARVLACRRPDLVAGVIAVGSCCRDPLALNVWLLAHALALASFGTAGVAGLVRLSCAAGACCAGFRGDLAAAVPAGLEYLSIYSRTDGVVDWRACVEPAGRHAEVHSSHCGMAVDRVAMHIIERALAGMYPDAGARALGPAA